MRFLSHGTGEDYEKLSPPNYYEPYEYEYKCL